jgi:hypothetical protein
MTGDISVAFVINCPERLLARRILTEYTVQYYLQMMPVRSFFFDFSEGSERTLSRPAGRFFGLKAQAEFSMKFRRLSKSGLRVSGVALGSWITYRGRSSIPSSAISRDPMSSDAGSNARRETCYSSFSRKDRITRHGLPADKLLGGIDLATMLPAPITELSPIVTPGRIMTPPPIQTLFPIATGKA